MKDQWVMVFGDDKKQDEIKVLKVVDKYREITGGDRYLVVEMGTFGELKEMGCEKFSARTRQTGYIYEAFSVSPEDVDKIINH